MNIFRIKSIHQRFVLGLAIVITVTLLIFSATFIFYNARSTEKDLQRQMDRFLTFSIQSLSSALWQYSHEYVNDYIDSLFLYEDVVFARVATETQIFKTKTRDGYQNFDFSIAVDPARFVARENDVMYNNVNVGKITIVMSKERIRQQIIYSSLTAISLLLLIIAAISITIYQLFRRYIFNPLINIGNSARLIAGGNLDAQIDTASEDEIGQLAHTFNQMMQSIKAITASRDELNHEITERKQAEEERKKLQEQLLQSQKMEAIGSLAGGIAHEFNNILGTIIGNTELAINDVPESNPARECLEEIQSASLRAKDVVRQILGFARKSVFQLVSLQISPIISETLELIRASIPMTIEIRRNLSCKSDTVMADPTQISQVLMNLCINAKDAMQEKGGVLEVKLENTSIDEKSAIRYEGLGPGNYVKMTVRDTGHGIDPKNIDRIFDPYFTTTSLAEGPGMGLAVVHGIVKHHKGAIMVESELGKGTVFEVLFPLTEAEEEQKTEKSEALPAGAERILFVDDEKALVKMAKRMLEMQGYQVEAKSDSVEALELFRSKPDRFDLIITDMTMPKMTGDKLAKEILSIRPDMPIILCSGFSEKIDAEKAKELGIRKYIEKPLNMSDFVVALRKVLDAESVRLQGMLKFEPS